MNVRQARRYFGTEKFQIIDFESQGWERRGLFYRPNQVRTLKNGKILCGCGSDSTAFLDPMGRLGLHYPNLVPEEIFEPLEGYFVYLMPLGWGPFNLVQGFHAHGTPLEHPGLPDDVRALSDLMDIIEQRYGACEIVLLGFADGDVFNTIAASSEILRDRVRAVIGVQGTIWEPTERFPLDLPPIGQSMLSVNGGANTQIRWDGKGSETWLGQLGERLVAPEMPPVHGPQLKLPRYIKANEGLVGRFTPEIQGDTRTGIVITTYRGSMAGRPVIAREIFDPQMPHEWSGRPVKKKKKGVSSESWLSLFNRRGPGGKISQATVRVNTAILAFLNELLD